MLDFLRKFLPKTDRPAPSAAGARGGFNYSGGPLFGPWDPSVHAAPGQYARFGRAAARPLSVFSKGGERTKVLDCDTKAKVLKSGGMKPLERGGAKAFIGRFQSGHTAVLQRQIRQTYTVGGAADRIKKYGYPSGGQWPDMTRIKKLLGPSVPSMLGNEEIQEKTRTMLYTVLDQEIEKRINKAIRQSA